MKRGLKSGLVFTVGVKEQLLKDLGLLNSSHKVMKLYFLSFPSIDCFSNNETRTMINNLNLRGLILMKLKIYKF